MTVSQCLPSPLSHASLGGLDSPPLAPPSNSSNRQLDKSSCLAAQRARHLGIRSSRARAEKTAPRHQQPSKPPPPQAGMTYMRSFYFEAASDDKAGSREGSSWKGKKSLSSSRPASRAPSRRLSLSRRPMRELRSWKPRNSLLDSVGKDITR